MTKLSKAVLAAFLCACSTNLSKAPKSSVEVSDDEFQVTNIPSHKFPLAVLVRLAAQFPHVGAPSDLENFERHSGYKLVFDKTSNYLHLFRGNQRVKTWHTVRSVFEGEKDLPNDWLTPEGIFQAGPAQRTYGKKASWKVWIPVEAAQAARTDYLRLHGAEGRRAISEFERKYGAITTDSHVRRFNDRRSNNLPRMWRGIGIHGGVGVAFGSTEGCIGLYSSEALELHDYIKQRRIPVLILPSVNYPAKSAAPLEGSSRGGIPVPFSRNVGMPAVLSPGKRRVFRRRQ